MLYGARRLSLKNRLIVIACICRLRLTSGIGNIYDLHWFIVAESWLRAFGIDVTARIDEERAA